MQNRWHACINVTGLALALIACIVLGLYLYDEFTYGRHNQLHEHIYRVEAAGSQT